MTERDITRLLWQNYGVKNKYFCKNRYIFSAPKIGSWESDSFMLSRSKLSTDYEVKISHPDFLNEEGKKEKHKFLLETFEQKGNNLEGTRYTAPNYFIFVAPEGIITPEEVEDKFPYASLKLITVGGTILTPIRKKLHPIKQDLTPKLLEKFYYENLALNKAIYKGYRDYKNGKLDISKLFKELRIK